MSSIFPCKERAPDNLLTVLEKRSGKLKINRRNEFNVVRVFMLPAGVLRRRRYKRTRFRGQSEKQFVERFAGPQNGV